ncbi:TPA: plasmid partitioning/stability family protein, partial [Escherichia coli]|nr:plasmid stabilization protein [Escherichia coli]EGZ1699518.1 plasmid stabilization protein [Escherichia coli]EGZ7911353.1 plasmid stabilization protein [Escherichia coli]EHC8188634.1 plasmid stabilization protein [Escherichia coli]EHK9854088.1 plasmid partitioning/stability family protein [Escherichia coli]
MESSDPKKRKKVVAYLHPTLYPQDNLTQQTIDSLPIQMRGDFYRQSLICGAALYSVDPRLLTLISVFFSEKITAENLVKLIEQTTGYTSTSIDISVLKNIIGASSENKSESITSKDD